MQELPSTPRPVALRQAPQGDQETSGTARRFPEDRPAGILTAASGKHGVVAGEAGLPARPDWTIDQDWESYTAEEHGVWKTLFERQARLLQGRVCDQFAQAMLDLPIGPHQIPDFGELSDVLKKRTGFEIVAVPGMVPDDVFFEHLANRRFPSGQFIRKPHELDYLEEPDVFHDVFGHVPMLMNPVIADFAQAYGEGGMRAKRLGKLTNLARLYWYSIEFGLIRQHDGLRIFGAGIASSSTETLFALESPSPNRIGFDLERVMRTHYRIDDFQESYFVINAFEDLLALASIDFGPLYERLGAGPVYEPGDVLATDDVLTRGDGSYHAAKRTKSTRSTT